MFRFICGSISGRALPLRHISSNSTNANTNQHSFTVSYLINTYDFSQKSALAASNYLHFETPHQPDSVLCYFKDHGFSESQIATLVRRYPRLLSCNPQQTFWPKLEFLYSKGVSVPDVAKIITSYPCILLHNLENHLVLTFDFLNNLFQSSDITIEAIKRYPRILQRHPVFLSSVLDILRDNGVPEKNIVLLARKYSSTLMSTCVNQEKFKKLVEEVMKMGFDTSRFQFVLAIRVMNSMSRSAWEKKLDVYRSWGLSEEEILVAFIKYPSFMALPEQKIMAGMDLFVNNLGWESSYIAKRPLLIALNLEKRLIPRAKVLQFLVSEGYIKKGFRSHSFFVLSDTNFMRKFMNCYDEAPELLKLYHDKLALPS